MQESHVDWQLLVCIFVPFSLIISLWAIQLDRNCRGKDTAPSSTRDDQRRGQWCLTKRETIETGNEILKKDGTESQGQFMRGMRIIFIFIKCIMLCNNISKKKELIKCPDLASLENKNKQHEEIFPSFLVLYALRGSSCTNQILLQSLSHLLYIFHRIVSNSYQHVLASHSLTLKKKKMLLFSPAKLLKLKLTSIEMCLGLRIIH